MKVLHYGLSNHLGGIETYLKKLTFELHNTNEIEFHFLIIGRDLPCYYHEFKKLGCKFHFITPRKNSLIKNYFELKKLFIQEKYDVCHVHLNSLSYTLPAKLAAKYSNKLIVHSRNSNVKLNFSSNLLHKINYYTLPKKSILLAVSDLAGKWMFKNKKFRVINNGIKIKKYLYNSQQRELIRQELNLENNIVFINVGAFRYQKNHVFLLKIFKELLMYNENYKLLLVGDGSLSNDLEHLATNLGIEKSVIFLKNRNDIPNVLSASDAFIFPSFYEGFPNALLEAHVSNLPTFYSDSITNNIDHSKLSNRISLNSTAKEWAEIIEYKMKNNLIDRNKHDDEIEMFSIDHEINIIKSIYKEDI